MKNQKQTKEFEPNKLMSVTAGTVIDIARCLAVISRQADEALAFVVKATEEDEESNKKIRGEK